MGDSWYGSDDKMWFWVSLALSVGMVGLAVVYWMSP
jgi:hypothetical protein